MMRNRTSLFLSSIFILLLVVGCGGGSNPDLGEWTLKTDGLTVDQDLQVSDTGTYFFGFIEDLAVTSGGHMVVLDSEAMHLKVLQPDGTLIDTLGRRGQGPGEFQGATRVEVARGDSIYVFDNNLDRLSVFSPPPSPEWARSTVITSEKGNLTSLRVLSDQLVGELTLGYTRKEGLYRPSPNTWYALDKGEVSGDSLLSEHRQQVATSFGGQGAAIAYLPFGRATRVAAGPNRLYHGFTDSLQIRATSLDGTTEVIATVPTDPIPVTEAERDSTLEDIPSAIRRPITSSFPETKPAFTDLVVAEDGRLWVRRPSEGLNVQTVSWWVLNPESKTVYEIQLGADVRLEVVRDGIAYGTATTESGAPAVVQYRIES